VPPVVDHKETIKKISNWAQISRKNGLLGLEDQIYLEEDPYIKKALKLLIDEGSPQALRRVLEADLILSEQRDQDAVKFYSSMGGYAPTIGIIGAVMGLIYVMRNLADPAELGAGIAVAFFSTIYGVAVANLLLLPIANKLTIYINNRSHLKELIIEGSIYVADGENPRSIELKLDGYIS
jgi:chemotaxis protein MotA